MLRPRLQLAQFSLKNGVHSIDFSQKKNKSKSQDLDCRQGVSPTSTNFLKIVWVAGLVIMSTFYAYS